MFEIPSNLLFARIGARLTFARILIIWGAIAACMSLASGATSLIVLRFLLGVFEAGFAPGVLLYITLWFGPRQRGKVIAIYSTSVAVAGIIGAPISTFLMTRFDNVLGFMGWQWMFVLQGLPVILLGIIAYKTLPDRPEDARWLTRDEKRAIVDSVTQSSYRSQRSSVSPFRDPVVYAMSLCYFGYIFGLYGMSFWLPTIIASAGESDLFRVGLYGAVPYLVAIVIMHGLGRSSDSRSERFWHSAIPAFLGSIFLVFTVNSNDSFSFSLLGISLVTGCIYGAYSIFWTIPSEYFGASHAPGGLALVNTIGLLGGLASPICIGWLEQRTGTLNAALLMVATILALSAFGLLMLRSRLQRSTVPSGAPAR